MMHIRKAKTCECEKLTNIAVKSEAYWGYDLIYMEKFKLIYNVTKKFINNNLTYVIEKDRKIIGFYGVLISDEVTSLEYFYIEPNNIGKGYGKLLWKHLIKKCKGIGATEIVFVTSPKAKGFYIKMGALQLCEVCSSVVKNRKIPKFSYIIKK